MSVGNFLAGAGDVSRGMRRAERENLFARQQQQLVQDENRRVAGLRESAQVGTGLNPEPVAVPDFGAMAAGQPMPAGRSYTPEQRAQMRESMTPDDRAIALYGQGTTPAPGQQPAPSANPPQPAQGVSPAPAQQPGLAASPPPAWQPAPRGPDGMAIMPDPREPRAGVQSTVDPQQTDAKRRLIAPANAGITEAQLAAMSPQEREQVLQVENDYRNFTRGFGQESLGPVAAATDIALAPVKFGANALAALGNTVGLPRLGRALGVAPGDSGDIPYFTEPYQYMNRVKEWGERRGPLTADQMRGRPEEVGVPTEAPAETAAEEPKAEPAKEPPKGPAASALTATGGTGVKQQSKAATPENPSAFYAAHPESIAADRRRLDDTYQRMRDSAYKRAEIANRYGQTEKLEQMQQTVLMLDAQYEATARMLEGQQAVAMFEYAGDPRAMGMILSSQLDGTPVGFNPRDDGTWDLFIGEDNYNGTYSMAQITSMVREFTDVNFREAMAATMSESAMLEFKNQLETKLELTKIEAETLQKIVLEAMRGRNMLAVAQQTGNRYSMSFSPDGEAVLTERGSGQVYAIDLQSGQLVDTPAGKVQAPARVRTVDIP